MLKTDHDPLVKILRAHPRMGSAELCARLGGINRATFMRAIRALGEAVVAGGSARRTRYALRRPLRGSIAPIPLYRIDTHGRGHEIGELSLTYPAGSLLSFRDSFPWPLDRNMADGWFGGLPYPIVDMRPQGFLGRNFARNHALDLGVSDKPETWSDDDMTHVLAMTGYDQPGNLILGETAYRRFLEFRHQGENRFLRESQIETEYPRLADLAIAHGDAWSSAGGEFPKFLASRELDDRKADVIVKFSGADDSPAVRRWADLLICEHLASVVMAQALSLQTAESAVRRHAGRTFLEIVRFDRHGNFGRSGVCTLDSLNAALAGTAGVPWRKTALALQTAGCPIADETVANIHRIWWFGKLIGNTDMHEGNLAFRPDMTLAPLYDMLPMMYAPMRGGEVADKPFSPKLPLPDEAEAWNQAAQAAIRYWETCAADVRVSGAFRRICEKNARFLEQLAGAQ